MKKILVIIMLLLFTGCKAEYCIEFIDDTITEKVVITAPGTLEYEAIKNNKFAPVPAFKNSAYNLEEPVKNEGVEYYGLTASDNKINLEYKFKIEEYEESYIANSCYNYFKIFREEDNIVLSTGKEFNCFYPGRDIDEIDVIITTNHKVLYNNADKVINNKYIWNLKNDDSDKNIQISFLNKKQKNNMFDLVLILTVSCGLFSIIIAGIYLKNKRVNKI